LGEGDRLIVPELSRLGRSMLEIMEILAVAKEREIHIYDLDFARNRSCKIKNHLGFQL
jgi:DNA invertase Pin-like site-specific DNA recombinase